MSTPPKISLHELLSCIGHAYSSVDVRHSIFRDGENWCNALTVIRFSEHDVEELKTKHANLESRLGKITTKDFAIILRALPIDAWEELRYEIVTRGVVYSIPGFEEGVTFEACQNISSQTGTIWPYRYLPEYEGWQTLEIRLASKVLVDELATIESQVRAAGFAGIYSTISSFLEIPHESSDPTRLLVVAPTLVRCHIDSVDLSARELKVTTEVHSKLQNCLLHVLVKKNGGLAVQGRPVRTKKTIPIDIGQGTESDNGFRLIQSRITLPQLETTDELELMIMANSTLLFDISEAIRKGPLRVMSVNEAPEPDKRKVFVVYGRNEKLREDIFSFLRALDLSPMEWSEAVSFTGKATPYTGEVLDAAFSRAMAVVVVLSPDDEARLLDEFVKPDDPDSEKQLTPQPRPNVLFEAGFAFGSRPDRTIIVKIGNLRPISDIHGRNEIRLSNDPRTRKELVSRLQITGCAVNLSGSDWLKIGNFDLRQNAIQHPPEKKESKRINMEEAKRIALQHVLRERPESKDAKVHTAELIGKDWRVSGDWMESSAHSVGSMNFDVLIDSETKDIKKSEFKTGFAAAG